MLVRLSALSVKSTAAMSSYRPTNLFFCAGRVNANGTKAADTGRISCTPSKQGVGIYWTTYATAYPNANFVVVGSATNNYSFIVVGGATTTARAELVLYSGVNTNAGKNLISSSFNKIDLLA